MSLATNPALILGVERRCAVATDRNAAEGRPYGLYGNNFSEAKADAIQRATRALNPPTVSNILAMEAPAFGTGFYTPEQIDYILTTAYTGYRAARFESAPGRAMVHTGFWGCGAYGGNRVLMALLQLLAAQLSGLERIVFHTVDAAGTQAFAAARDLFDQELARGHQPLRDILARIDAMHFAWGVGDGN